IPVRKSSSKTRSHVPKTMDPPSILYMTGSAVGPYRLVKTRRPTPSSGSSAMHSASPSRSSMRGALAPGPGEAAPRGELGSASSSGIVPTLALCPVTAGGRRGLPQVICGPDPGQMWRKGPGDLAATHSQLSASFQGPLSRPYVLRVKGPDMNEGAGNGSDSSRTP